MRQPSRKLLLTEHQPCSKRCARGFAHVLCLQTSFSGCRSVPSTPRKWMQSDEVDRSVQRASEELRAGTRTALFSSTISWVVRDGHLLMLAGPGEQSPGCVPAIPSVAQHLPSCLRRGHDQLCLCPAGSLQKAGQWVRSEGLRQ